MSGDSVDIDKTDLTVKIQIRSRVERRLIWLFTVKSVLSV